MAVGTRPPYPLDWEGDPMEPASPPAERAQAWPIHPWEPYRLAIIAGQEAKTLPPSVFAPLTTIPLGHAPFAPAVLLGFLQELRRAAVGVAVAP
jgi:hypothetical protein